MNPSSSGRFEMAIPADFDYLPLARGAVEETVKALGLCGDALDNLRLVLTEVVANAVKANNAAGHPSSTVRVRWMVRDDGVEVEVADEGGGFDRHRVPQPAPLGTEPSLHREGGFGLDLIESYADEADFRPRAGGTDVRFVIRT